MRNKDKVDFLNTLIETAVKNGADAGGSYNQAEDELKEAIDNMLIAMELDEEYCVATYNKYSNNSWSPFYVVEKSEFEFDY